MGTWFSYRNWVDASSAVFTASDEAGDLVVENLQNRYYYKRWRAAELTEEADDAWFQVDFGQAREVGCLVLLFPRTNNLPDSYDETPSIHPSSDMIRHRLDADTPGDGALLDDEVVSGVVAGYGYHVYKLSSPVSARYWRCDLEVPSRASETYVDVVRAWAGPVFEPAVGVSLGVADNWQSDSSITAAARGLTKFVDPRESLRSYVMTFNFLTSAERDQVDDLDRLMTTAGQFIVCRDDLTVVKGTMLASQQRSTGLQAAGAFLRHQKQFQLVESL